MWPKHKTALHTFTPTKNEMRLFNQISELEPNENNVVNERADEGYIISLYKKHDQYNERFHKI
jgi:hypothetical protein